MMKLSIMRDFLESDVLSPNGHIISRILEKWGYSNGDIEFLRASNNFILKFEKDREQYVIRLTDVNKTRKEDIEGELDYLKLLSDNNICINTPLKSLDGNNIEVFDTPIGQLYAVVFNYFKGTIYDIEELDDSQFTLWGEALGSLHSVSQKYKKNNRLSSFDHLDIIDKHLSRSEYFAHKELAYIKNWINTLNKNDSSYGLIHFDFELDNLIWDGRKIQIIDFESCIYSWYIADIAFALRDIFDHDLSLSNKQFIAFIEGYKKKKDLRLEDLGQIKMFLRLHDLLMFTILKSALDIEKSDSKNNPKWIKNIEHKLENKMDKYRSKFKSYHKQERVYGG